MIPTRPWSSPFIIMMRELTIGGVIEIITPDNDVSIKHSLVTHGKITLGDDVDLSDNLIIKRPRDAAGYDVGASHGAKR